MDFKHYLKKKGYSNGTISTYDSNVRQYELFLQKNQKQQSEETITEFLDTVDSIYYRQIMSRALYLYSIYLGLETSNPNNEVSPLTEEEFRLIFNSQPKIKYRLMLLLLYETHLEVRKLRRIRLRDFDLQGKVLYGNIDLSDEACELIQQYIKECEPTEFLFQGREGPSATSLFQAAVTNSFKISGINRAPSLKAFRKEIV